VRNLLNLIDLTRIYVILPRAGQTLDRTCYCGNSIRWP